MMVFHAHVLKWESPKICRTFRPRKASWRDAWKINSNPGEQSHETFSIIHHNKEFTCHGGDMIEN